MIESPSGRLARLTDGWSLSFCAPPLKPRGQPIHRASPLTIAPCQSFLRMLTSLIGQKSPIGGSFPAV